MAEFENVVVEDANVETKKKFDLKGKLAHIKDTKPFQIGVGVVIGIATSAVVKTVIHRVMEDNAPEDGTYELADEAEETTDEEAPFEE